MKLVFHTAQDGIQKYEVDKSSVLIGRGSSCDVQIKVDGISRQHCLIEMDPRGEFIITDLGSTNGVLIDNQRISANKPTPYMSFLPLTIGSIPHVTIEAGDHVQFRTIDQIKNPKKSKTIETPLMKLELEDKSKTMSRLTRSGVRKNQSKSSKVEIGKARPPWLVIILSALSILAATYFLFFR
jgi:pSer/pThr/pTyr-binding forkhead associated (FHA) protein